MTADNRFNGDYHPLLAGLGTEQRDIVAGYLEEIVFTPGSVVIREGDRERDLYLIMDGEGSIARGALSLGIVGAGEHVGELGLLAERPRAATIIATSLLTAARLSGDAFDTLAEASPRVALELVRALVGDIRERLTEMTENVSELLRERSLPRQATVRVTSRGRRKRASTGTRLERLLPGVVDGRVVVAALVDQRPESMTASLSSDAIVEPLTTGHWEGRRVYRRSLALLLLEAARSVDPVLEVRMLHSLGFAQRLSAFGPGVEDLDTLARTLEERMRELAREGAPLRQEWWTVEEARAYFRDVEDHGAAALLSTWRAPAVRLVSFGKLYTLAMGPLVPNASLLEGFGVMTSGSGLLLVYGPQGADPEAPTTDRSDEARAASRTASSMTGAHDRWLRTLGVTTVGQLNRRCIDGDVSEVIRVAEGFHEKRTSAIADEIHALAREVRVVCMSGPSSSGKTTFIKRLKVQLQVAGINPVELSLDNYYVDRASTPRDADGEYDYEAFEALRADLLQEHLSRLLAGEQVATARYDFMDGSSHPNGGRTLALGFDDVLLLEGIHGLNPELLAGVDAGRVFRVFTCPLAQLPFDRLSRVHASDLRLLRRIVRDRHSRGATAAESIARWPSVRRGERRHIFPYQDNADAVFDSSLIYEISVLKVFAERYLLEVPRDRPEYVTASRLLQLTDQFVTIYPDHVPQTSILREFIGGSSFEY